MLCNQLLLYVHIEPLLACAAARMILHACLLQDLSSSGISSTSDDPASSSDIRMEGYLFKRTSNTFKTWVR